MKEFIDKLISRLEEEHKLAVEDAERYEKGNSSHFKYGKARGYATAMEVAIETINELAEEYKHCTLCYLQSPCEYQNEDARLPLSELADENGWIPCERELPKDETKKYIVQETDGFIDILGFTKDAYRLGKYDFYEYKGKKKALFYDWDSEYGYIERECVAWMPLPPAYTEGE